MIGPSGSAVYSLSSVHDIATVNFDLRRRTIVFANGWVSDSRTKQIIQDVAKCCNDYNIILVDFATSISHLYRTSIHDMELASYALLKVIDTLLLQHYNVRDIIVGGFGVGAQIAAATCQIVARERLHSRSKLPLLVAVDPSHVCNRNYSNNHIQPDVADQVLVIHGNSGIYGMTGALGTIDYYPNGDRRLQPGCRSEVCSRVFALAVFAELVCHPKNFRATKCESWKSWSNGECRQNEVIAINLNFPDGVRGKFYSTTNARSPYGQGLMGAQPPKPKPKPATVQSPTCPNSAQNSRPNDIDGLYRLPEDHAQDEDNDKSPRCQTRSEYVRIQDSVSGKRYCAPACHHY